MENQTITMRKACACGGTEGFIVLKNGQDVVRCVLCKTHQYNAPRTETGREQRTVTTVHNGVKPKQRARVLLRDNGACVLCGRRDMLHVGHVLSVKDGLSSGLTETELNDDENLLTLCDECNLGIGKETMPVRLLLRVLAERTRRKTCEA